jgi:hypothetical protein
VGSIASGALGHPVHAVFAGTTGPGPGSGTIGTGFRGTTEPGADGVVEA